MTIHKMPCSVHLFLFAGDEVLLSQRQNTGYEDGNFSVVAGHVEQGETVLAAMIREAKEEAGIEIELPDLQVVGVMHRRKPQERIDCFLTATRWSGEVCNTEPAKCSYLGWFDLADLPESMVPYVRAALETYQKGEFFSTFGWERGAGEV